MKGVIYRVLPLLSILAALAVQVLVPVSKIQVKAARPYFTYVLLLALFVCAILLALSFASKRVRSFLTEKGLFIAGAFLAFNVMNIFTAKVTPFSTLYFPTLDRIFQKLVEDRMFLLKCIAYSLRLLLTGFLIGAVIGFFTGLFLGYSRRFSYWVRPLTKVLGPIPAAAWLPLALSVFPTAFASSVFLIAFAVWFQLTLMTSSGIQSIDPSYFEVARTLGASELYQIVKVAIPGAAPHIFLGLFNATCSSFLTLMVAEMVGTSAGIGWYINNQKAVMSYSGVYSGLILIAVLCSLILTLLFAARRKIIRWEKGIIKW